MYLYSILGVDALPSLQLEPCHTKSSILDHFLEETLKITMKNSLKSPPEIFKDNFKKCKIETRHKTILGTSQQFLRLFFFSRNVSVTVKLLL